MGKAALVSLLLALLPGCLAIRAGGGASYRGDAAQPHGTYDAELALLFPLPAGDGAPSWIASPVAIVRGGRSEGGWAAGGAELARRVGIPASRPITASCPFDGDFLGGRIEAGRDDVGRYLGGALVARRFFGGLGCPMAPTVSLVLNAGAYLGPVHGPAVGLHLLVGFD